MFSNRGGFNQGFAPDISYKTNNLLAYAGNQCENMVNLLAIGDSRTFQNQDNNPWPFAYRFNQGFINHALSFMGERYAWRKEYNLGSSGQTAAGFDTNKATLIPPVISRRPANERWDAVWWVGINDAIGGAVSAAAYEASFISCMKYLMNQGIQNIYVMGEVPYPTGYLGESAGTHAARIVLLKGYNTAMKNYCDKFSNLHYIENYTSYGSVADPDVSHADYNGADIHPGSIGSLILGRNLSTRMIATRGKYLTAPGIAITPNPWLEGVEAIFNTGTINNFYCSAKTSGVTTPRTAGEEGMIVNMDATGGQKDFNLYNTATTWAAAVMPGDILAMCLDFEILEATGAVIPPWGRIYETATLNFAGANWNPASYSKGTIPSGRQIYMSDPHLITAGKGGSANAMQPYLFSQAPVGTVLRYKLYEVSCRRLYTSPNAEYSAAATIPAHRHNIKCLTSTAAAGFTLTLPALYNVPDGTVKRFQDYEGNASVKNVTLAGNAAELIKDGAASGNTVVLNTNYFNKAYRADRGSGAWLAE